MQPQIDFFGPIITAPGGSVTGPNGNGASTGIGSSIPGNSGSNGSGFFGHSSSGGLRVLSKSHGERHITCDNGGGGRKGGGGDNRGGGGSGGIGWGEGGINDLYGYGLLGKNTNGDAGGGIGDGNGWNAVGAGIESVKNGDGWKKVLSYGTVGGESNGDVREGTNDTTWFAWRHVEKHEGMHCAGQFGNIFWMHWGKQLGIHESTQCGANNGKP